MRPHREFVHYQCAFGGLEQLDREHTDDTEFGGQPKRQLLCRAGHIVGQGRRGRDHQHADAVTLHRLDHRPGRALAERRARHHRRQFASQLHPLLDQHRHTVGQVCAGDLAGVGHVAGHPHAPSVIPSTDRLDHEWRIYPRGEIIQFVEVFEALDTHVAGHRGAQRLQPPAHDELVLGVHQSLRRRRHIDALGDQLLQQFGRHVLVVKRQRVGPGGNLAQGFKVGVRADH